MELMKSNKPEICGISASSRFFAFDCQLLYECECVSLDRCGEGTSCDLGLCVSKVCVPGCFDMSPCLCFFQLSQHCMY